MKKNVILTLLLAFLMIGTSVSATVGIVVKPKVNVKSEKNVSVKKDNRKVSKKTIYKQQNRSEVVYVQCCVTATYSFNDGGGFCCREVTLTTCADGNDCTTAAQRNAGLLYVLFFLGVL